MSLVPPKPIAISGAGLSVVIVAARFNEKLVNFLINDVRAHLIEAGVPAGKITLIRVPGSNELPVAVQMVVGQKKPDAVIALGVLIRGGTRHYELVANSASEGLQRIALDAGIPVINGVIVAETPGQASARCSGKIRRGREFAQAALEMAELRRRFKK